jgi:hypothetical protein
MRRESRSPDRARAGAWVVSLALLALLGAGRAGAGRITVLGDEKSPPKPGPVEVSVGANKEHVRISIEGDSGIVVSGRDSVRWSSHRHHGSGGDDAISMGHDVVVKAGEVVKGDAVSILGSVRIDGTVQGDAVSIGGSVILGPDAIVEGDAVSVGGEGVELGPRAVVSGEAVVLGGRIQQGSEARVGQRTQIGFLPAFNTHRPFFLRSGWIIFLMHLIFIGLIGWAIVKLLARRWAAGVATLRARAGESLLAGLGAGILYGIVGIPLLLVVSLILVAVVVGIPLVPLVLLLILIFPVPGYAVTSILLGQAVRGEATGAAPPDPRRQGSAFLLGHLLLSIPWFFAVLLRAALGAWFSVAGAFLLLAWGVLSLAVAFGWGAFLLARLGKRYPQPHAVPVAPAPAP